MTKLNLNFELDHDVAGLPHLPTNFVGETLFRNSNTCTIN